jgi:signal peptidase
VWAKLQSLRLPAWVLLVALLVMSIISAVVQSTRIIEPKLFLYGIQPFMAVGIFGLAWYLTRGLQDRVRHRSDRAFLVGGVVSAWFVLYFLTGLVTTYTNNSLVAGFRSVVINIWAFGVAAACIEFARHRLMLLAGRRHFFWVGTVIALILTMQQINFGLIPITHGLEGYIKLVLSDVLPALASSFLLSYLAVAGGLPSMLVYRLGLVAMTIFPPVIPKYDWYLRGVSSLLLATAVYVVMGRSQQENQGGAHAGRHRHPARFNDMMWLIVLVFMVLFLTGFFPYKPFTIVSNSMKPVFSRGSVVIVQKIHNPLVVKKGDIVQYKRTSILITHRVIAIEPATDGTGKEIFTTKGDNNNSQDLPVTEEQIVGIVRARIPLIGYPTVWLRAVSTGLQPQP